MDHVHEGLRRIFVGGCVRADDGGVVHQHVDPPEAGDDLGGRRLHGRQIADVHGLEHHAGGVHPVREGLEQRGIPVPDRDVRARGEHPFGHGEPDALARAGDDGRPAGEIVGVHGWSCQEMTPANVAGVRRPRGAVGGRSEVEIVDVVGVERGQFGDWVLIELFALIVIVPRFGTSKVAPTSFLIVPSITPLAKWAASQPSL